MSSLPEISTALIQLIEELESIERKESANLNQSLIILEIETSDIQKREVEGSTKTLSCLSTELESIDREEFSFMKTLRIEKDELVHSNFLAWLLDPKEDHGLGSLFARRLLEIVVPKNGKKSIVLSSINLNEILVEREVSSETSRLDIRFMDIEGTFHCTIENKIFSPEGERQTDRLYRDFHGICPSELFIFLTLSGKEKPGNANFIHLTYVELMPVLRDFIEVASADAKLLIKNYLNTLERLIVAETFNGYSERTQLYFRYVKQINEIKSAYDVDRRLLLSALEEGIKERPWWDESVWMMEKTGSEISIWKPSWYPNEEGVYFYLRPWIEAPACDLFIQGSPASFSAKFVHPLKKELEVKYPGKNAGDFVKHLTGINTFLERVLKFSLTEKDQVAKILSTLDEAISKFEKIIDSSVNQFSKKQ